MPYKSVLTCFDHFRSIREGRLPIGVVMEEPNGAGVQWRFARPASEPSRDPRFQAARAMRQKIEGLECLWMNVLMFARYGPPPEDEPVIRSIKVVGWPLWWLPSPREWMTRESSNEYQRNTFGLVRADQDFDEFYHLAVAGRGRERLVDLPRDRFLAEYPSPPLAITLWRPGLNLWWPGVEMGTELSPPGTREHFEASAAMLTGGIVGYALTPGVREAPPTPIRAQDTLA